MVKEETAVMPPGAAAVQGKPLIIQPCKRLNGPFSLILDPSYPELFASWSSTFQILVILSIQPHLGSRTGGWVK